MKQKSLGRENAEESSKRRRTIGAALGKKEGQLEGGNHKKRGLNQSPVRDHPERKCLFPDINLSQSGKTPAR